MDKSSCLQKSQEVVKQSQVVSDLKDFFLFLKWFQAQTALFWFTHTSPQICTAGEKNASVT